MTAQPAGALVGIGAACGGEDGRRTDRQLERPQFAHPCSLAIDYGKHSPVRLPRAATELVASHGFTFRYLPFQWAEVAATGIGRRRELCPLVLHGISFVDGNDRIQAGQPNRPTAIGVGVLVASRRPAWPTHTALAALLPAPWLGF